MGSVKNTEDAALEPEAVKAMIDAYDSIVSEMNGHATPLLKDMVAKRVVELALAGERDPQRLRNQALLHIA